MTSIDRTAYPRFRRTMSAREIADVFTPLAEEIEWARDKTVAAPNMLALVAWLKSFQYLGNIGRISLCQALATERMLAVSSRRRRNWSGPLLGL